MDNFFSEVRGSPPYVLLGRVRVRERARLGGARRASPDQKFWPSKKLRALDRLGVWPGSQRVLWYFRTSSSGVEEVLLIEVWTRFVVLRSKEIKAFKSLKLKRLWESWLTSRWATFL